MSETIRSMKLKVCILCVSMVQNRPTQYKNHKIVAINMEISKFNITQSQWLLCHGFLHHSHPTLCCMFTPHQMTYILIARRAGSEGSMSASGSAGPGFDPRHGRKFSFENFQPWGQEGWRCTLSNRQVVLHTPGLNSKPFRSMYVEKAYSTVDSDSSVVQGH